MEILIYYDLMIVKLVIYGVNCDVVIQCMIEAIEMYEIEGVEMILLFGKFVCEYEVFISGKFDIYFVKYYFMFEVFEKGNEGVVKVVVKLFVYLFECNKIQFNVLEVNYLEWQN